MSKNKPKPRAQTWSSELLLPQNLQKEIKKKKSHFGS